ncbi:UBP1-associated protein 2A isoform X1 [Rosa chinensis]|uniref:UBP1-associated protein 2A isoform X1 n=2 Tax=Rosa chinensis TaxID=74649 RepID=UPI001AD8FD8C|nr:UBP1-associated protein 2A isoform X1 [Rosa chinensis]
MAKIQTTKKRRLVKTADKNLDKTPKAAKLEPKQEQEHEHEHNDDLRHKQPQTGSDSDSDSDPETLSQLLEPYSKEQLISLITDAASNDSSLFKRIRDAADADVSHRKIFVHGLGWDTTRETLVSAFQPYGDVEDSNLVMDKLTGKTKGYGFVLFKTRRGALKALKEPKKSIGNRSASCQLASVGPGNNTGAPSSSSSGGQSDSAGRKIYVSGVPHEAEAEKLRVLFGRFGEIETGPMGFDSQTGKSRGFALFLYKSVEGAKKALEEPVKVFEGHQLNCQKATEGSKNKNAVGPAQQQTQAPPLATVPGAQNMAFFGQYPGLNPLYGGLMTNVGGALVPGSGNPAMMARPLNPGLLAGALNPGVFPAGQYGQVGAGVGGFGGVSHGMGSFGGGGSLLGAYGSIAPLPAMQSLQHVYPSSQTGQTATVRPQGSNGYQPYMCSQSRFVRWWSATVLTFGRAAVLCLLPNG